MTDVRTTSSRIGAGIVLAGALMAAAPALGQVVGKASAVNTASKASGRTLSIGASIVHNERITTDAAGSVHVLFLDKTSLNIGHNSTVTINKFVYNTETKSGSSTVTVTKGLLRYVGGKTSRDGDSTVNTPSSSIGVRGYTGVFRVIGQTTEVSTITGVASIYTCPNRPVTQPSATDCPNGQVTTVPAGYTATINGTATTPTLALTTSTQANAGLDPMSRQGQTGGVSRATSNAVVTASNISPLTNPPGNVGQTPQTVTPGTSIVSATGGATNTTTDAFLTNIVTGDVQTSTNNAAAQTTSVNSAAAFTLLMTNCCNPNNQSSPVPYLPANFAIPGQSFVSPVLGIRTASNNGQLAPATALQYGFTVNGLGSNQSSLFFVSTGNFTDNGNGGLNYSGGFVATRRAAANFVAGVASGSVSSPAGSIQSDASRLPVSGTVNQNAFNASTGAFTNQNATFFPGTATSLGTLQNYQFTQTFSAVGPPAGLGNNRPTVTLNGYIGSLVQTNFGVPFVTVNQHLSPNDVTVQLDATTNRVQAIFNLASTTSLSPLTPNPTDTASFQFGSLTDVDARGSYVDYNTFGARDGVTTTSTGTTPKSNVNGTPLTQHQGALVAISPAVAQQVANGLASTPPTFCDCEFTRWGVWSTSDTQQDGTGNLVHMGFWVAGRLPTAAEVPTTGTATYAGHVIANVSNNGSQYISAGNFTNAVDFGARTGTVNVGGAGVGPGLDGSNYTGTVRLAADPRNFAGTLNDTGSLGRVMTMNGSFFRSSTSPVGEMGGSVAVTNSVGSYLAAGIFAGKR